MRQDKRADDLTSEAEKAAGNGRMKELYEIIKKISNDKGKTMNAVKDKAGNLITDDKGRKERWRAL